MGRYDVYAMWNTFAWATNAPYTVYHDGGSTAVRVNQRANFYTLMKLGTFDLTPGSGTPAELRVSQPLPVDRISPSPWSAWHQGISQAVQGRRVAGWLRATGGARANR